MICDTCCHQRCPLFPSLFSYITSHAETPMRSHEVVICTKDPQLENEHLQNLGKLLGLPLASCIPLSVREVLSFYIRGVDMAAYRRILKDLFDLFFCTKNLFCFYVNDTPFPSTFFDTGILETWLWHLPWFRRSPSSFILWSHCYAIYF